MGRKRDHPTDSHPGRRQPTLFRRVRVEGPSMLPALAAGDRLLVGPAVRLRPGQIVAVHDAGAGRLLVKRVHALGDDWVDVRGDNTGFSTDSRQFGVVSRKALRGRVYYRYGPADRAEWWPGQRE